MEIQSVQGTTPPPKPPMSTEPLTDDERSVIEEILAKYDAENMSEEDKQTLMEELKESGIEPNKEIGAMMEDQGFEVGKPPKGPKPPKPKEMDEETQSLFAQYESGELSEDELKELLMELHPEMTEFPGELTDQFV